MSLLLSVDAPVAPSASYAALDFDDEDVLVTMRKNVAGQVVAGQMNDRSTGAPLTASVSVLVTGDGGTQTAGGGTLTHKGNGHWNYAPTQAETNFNHVAFTFTHASGVHKTYNVYTVSYNPHDTVRLGITALPNAAAEAAGGLFTRGTGAGQINQQTNGQIDSNVERVRNAVINALIAGRVDANAQVVGDKTGYSLTQAFPTNFAAMAITAGGAVTVGTNNDKTGYSLTQAFPTNFAAMAITGGGAVTVGTNNDKTGYSLTQAFPTNFAAMAITAGGAVTVGTNNDKTGYSLTQAFPTNFAAMAITAGGIVDADVKTWRGTVPNVLVANRVDSSVGAMAADVITDTALATSAVDEIVNAMPEPVAGSSALNARADTRILTIGTETGTVADTRTANGVLHRIDDTTDQIDIYYEFNVGLEGVPVSASARANVQSTNDTLIVYSWNWDGGVWEEIGVLPGSGSTALADFSWPLFRAHVGTEADLGKVRVRFAILSGGSNPSLEIDLLYVSFAVVPVTDLMHAGGVVSATASTLVLDSTGPTGDTLFPARVVVISPAGVYQSRRAESYTGSTKTFVLATNWTVIPDSTYTVRVFSWASVRVSDNDAAVDLAIADAILGRDLGSGTNAGTLDERTVRSALRFLRNKWNVSSGTLTVTKENDTTSAWTSAVTGTAGADPITGSDPT